MVTHYIQTFIFKYSYYYIMEKEIYEEFLESAEENFNKGRYTAACEDYSKAIFIMIDFYLKKKYNITVDNHSERRLHLESLKNIDKKCEELLIIYLAVYKIYRETYNRKLSYSEAVKLREYAKKVLEIIK